MRSEEWTQYIPWILLLLLALWLLSTGAHGAFSSNTILGVLFAVVIFLVGFQLLTKTATRWPPSSHYEED